MYCKHDIDIQKVTGIIIESTFLVSINLQQAQLYLNKSLVVAKMAAQCCTTRIVNKMGEPVFAKN